MILFEGMDKTGKTTLYNAFNKFTGYQYLCCDRYFLSYIAYAIVENRFSIDFSCILDELPKKLFLVYLESSEESIKERCIASNHKIRDFQKDFVAFELAHEIIKALTIQNNNTHVRVLRVNTDELTQYEAVELIHEQYLNFINETKEK